jgi:hypothetical protein
LQEEKVLLTQINQRLSMLQAQYSDVRRDPTLPNNVPNSGPRIPVPEPAPVTRHKRKRPSARARSLESETPAVTESSRLPNAAVLEITREADRCTAAFDVLKKVHAAQTIDLEKINRDLEMCAAAVVKAVKVPAKLKLVDSGVFSLEKKQDLAGIFATYSPKGLSKTMATKSMGLPVPLALHERMVAFLAEHKAEENSPQSLRDLGLMCIGFAMDHMPKSKKE